LTYLCAMFRLSLIAALLLLTSTAKAQSPYEVGLTRDALIGGGSLAVAFVGASLDDSLTIPTQSQIAGLDKSTINGFDRWATNFSSRSLSSVSDGLVIASLATPIAVTFIDPKMRSDWFTLGVMYFETGLLATFIPSFGKGTVTRYRPYAYNPKTPKDPLYTDETNRSFFSGHSTWAFASMTFLANVYSDYYPNSEWKDEVWIATMGTASGIALLRVFSGAHFPTDVLLGSAVGFGIGTLIPWLHRTDLNVQIAPDYRSGGLILNYQSAL
jgi:membrane-associated phospholipid phosphatase